MDGTEQLRAELVRAAVSLGAPESTEPIIERPRDPSFGDWATNLAMVLAKALGTKPRDLAAAIIEGFHLMREDTVGFRTSDVRNLLGREPDALVDHLETGVAGADGDLLGAIGVPVQARLADEQAQAAA